jgi:hypothetical protein
MDTRERVRALLESMDDEQWGILSEELAVASRDRRGGVNLEDITPERLRDPEFAAAVRSELNAVLKQKS